MFSTRRRQAVWTSVHSNTKNSRTQDSLREFSSINFFSRVPFNVSFFFHTPSIPSLRNPSFYSKKPLCNVVHGENSHITPSFLHLPCAEPWDVYSLHLIGPISSFQHASCLPRGRVVCINAKSAFSRAMQYYYQNNSRIWVQANILSLLESGLSPPTHTWTRFSLPCHNWLRSLFSVWKVFSAAHCMGTLSKRLKTCPECRCAAIVDPQQMFRSVWIDPCTQKSPYVHLTFRIISKHIHAKWSKRSAYSHGDSFHATTLNAACKWSWCMSNHCRREQPWL